MRRTTLFSSVPNAVIAVGLIITTLVASGATATRVSEAAHPGPNGPVAFSHVQGAIIIAQPGQTEPSQWTKVIRPPTGTTVTLNEASISPDGRRVAYLLEGPFDTELHVYDIQTETSLAVSGGQVGTPSWTPDGSSVIFTVTDASDLLRKVAIADIDNRTSRLLATIPTGETAIAPAGDQILYWDDVDDQLGLLDVATGEQRVIFTSGTGGIIVGQTLRAIRPGGGPPRPEVNVIQANWAPDSRSFVFNCGFVDANAENNGFLCRINSDGTGVRLITGGPFSGNTAGGSFTPAGDGIIFSAFPNSAPRLYFMPSSGMNADASNVTRITNDDPSFAHTAPDVGVPFGTTPPPAGSIGPTPVPSGGGGNPDADIRSLTPARLLDTRTSASAETIDGRFEGTGRVPAGQLVELDVLGRGGVPQSGVASVVLNITAVNPTGNGFLTTYPCGTRPNASSLNYEPATNRASEVIAKVSDAGKVCVYTSSASHLIGDVTGYVPDGADFASVTPARLLDTRTNGSTIDDLLVGGGKVPGGSFVEIQVTGRGGVPANGVSSAVLNVTGVGADGSGFLTVYSCGDLPNASALNYRAANNVANEVTTQLTATGTVCIYTEATAHVLVDVTGYTTPASEVSSIVPARLLETRSGNTTIDQQFAGMGKVAAGDFVELTVTARGGVPGGADSAILNVTAIRADAKGFFTVYPCGDRPLASSLNYEANTNTANEIVAKLSSTGTVCVFTSATTHVIVDVTGHVS